MTPEQLETLLSSEMAALGASSLTLYVQDPYWSDEYRLVCMPGVKIREPMYGFMFPETAKKAISEGAAEIYCPDGIDPRMHDELPPLPKGIKEEWRLLFSSFAPREGVKSCARLFHLSPQGTPAAILFVNFSRHEDFDELLKQRIRELLTRIIENLPTLSQYLKEIDAAPLAESVRILRPAQAVARSTQESPATSEQLRIRFTNILKSCLEALGISESCGLGTIHLIDDSHVLRLAAYCGAITYIDRARAQDTSTGQGVISWVALRYRGVLISDLEHSPFGDIYIRLNDDVKSELAVPMIVDGNVVGVLNLECTRAKAFSPNSVRSIWYAANSAALAYHLSQHSSLTRKLLQICWAATSNPDGARSSLKDLATLLRDAFSADLCDIWHFNSHLHRFDATGASYQPVDPAVRADGWSSYIRKHKCTIWVDAINKEVEYAVSQWNGTTWDKKILTTEHPATVNSRTLALGVKAELGLPITVLGECVGVAWVKFRNSQPPPTKYLVREAELLGSQAGLVLDLIQHQSEMPNRAAVQSIGAQLKKTLFISGSLDVGNLRCLEGHIVHSSAHPDVCGDFHTLKIISDSTIGLLLVDAEGHALTGLLNALPMIATAEAFGNDSGSTRYLMEKLMGMSNDLGVHGNALYCTFTLIEKSLWLSVTSAGNVRLVLIRQEPAHEVRELPPHGNPARGPSLGFDLNIPLQEIHECLHDNDVLIGYTDGVSDALGVPHRLEALEIARIAAGSILGSSQEIAAAVIKPAGRVREADDATVFVLKVHYEQLAGGDDSVGNATKLSRSERDYSAAFRPWMLTESGGCQGENRRVRQTTPTSDAELAFEPHLRQSTVKKLQALITQFRYSIGQPEAAATKAALRDVLTEAYRKSALNADTRNLATAISLLQDFLRPHWSQISTQKLDGIGEKLASLGDEQILTPRILKRFYCELVDVLGRGVYLHVETEAEETNDASQ